MIYFNGVKQSKLDNNASYSHMFKKRTLKYWKQHHAKPLSLPATSKIDWKPACLATQRLLNGLKRWYAKFSSGHIGHNYCHFKLKQHNNLTCPICNTKEEKSYHVLICASTHSKKNFLISLKNYLSPT